MRSTLFLFALLLLSSRLAAAEISVTDYPSIQAAIDANPNKMLFVPAGDYLIQKRIYIRGERAGLYGPGRILQENVKEPIIEVEHTKGAELRDLTLTRPEGKMITDSEGIVAGDCRDLVLENVRVIDNQTRAGAITLRSCQGARVSRCLVRNYMRITVEDRTQAKEWGYAFNCTDGTGISVNACTGTLLEGNRVLEENLLPTLEIKEKHKLGDWVKKNPVKGELMSQGAWDRAYSDNWQQGSGIVVTSPEVSDLTRIVGNHIENAAQGIDLHCDHVIVANNIVVNSFMGMKAMHGSRNVLITGNQFVKNTLWAIGLMPGVSSKEGNTDGGSIIANNIISDFGNGDARWIWGDERTPMKFDRGQEREDPALTDVIVQGNMLHSVGTPQYSYAVVIEDGANAPRGMHFVNNHLPAGKHGVSNVELKE